MDVEIFIHKITQLRPNITTFHLIKLLYLFDLACLQVKGETCTQLPYKWWDHGPYCDEFTIARKQLQSEGKISITKMQFLTRDEGFVHKDTSGEFVDLPEIEDRLLNHVVRRFGRMSTKKLKNIVYNTPPMRKAIDEDAQYLDLDMSASNPDAAKLQDPEILEMLLSAEEIPNDRVSMNEVFERIDAT